MWTELILLTSALLGAYAETISARAGADVLLPCHCPENPQDSLYVAWQIGNHTIVDYYHSKWNKTDPNNKTDHKFLGRTQLFLPKDKGNCSLLLKNVETADNETYSCHHKNPDYTKADVTLIVSGEYPSSSRR